MKSAISPGQCIGRNHVKYIHADAEGTDFTEYFEYIQSLRAKLAPHVFEFASNQDYYNLSRSSLHDAWLISFDVKEPATGDRREIRSTEISLSLLGSFHDRRITLEYKRVKSYTFSSQDTEDGHGDLLIHEVRLSGAGFLVHEIQFVHGNFIIECEDFKHSQEVYV
jgi:hypothetical protein